MMFWTDFFIKRPVFAISLSLLISLAGIFCFFELPLQLLPTLEIPIITITTSYPGASTSTVKNFVTNVIQNGLAGIKGVNYITASSSQSTSIITVNMQPGVNAESALTDISQKINAIRGQLPQGINDPVINKDESNDNFLMLLAFTSNTMVPSKVTDYLLRAIKPQIESIDGVADMQIWGNPYAMRIWLDPTALAAHNLSTQDVMSALAAQNVQGSPGTLEGVKTDLNISTNSNLTTPDQFNNIAVKNVNGAEVRLQDLGQAQLGAESTKISAYFNGEPAVMAPIMPQTGINPLALVNNIKKLLPGIQQQLPAGLHMQEVVNIATFIKESMKEVMTTLVEALLIVAIVIFLFLGSFRSLLIPLVTIPISLIGTCFVLNYLGFSLNVLTLLALVISIGLVVDDAIVIMENIFRYIEMGESPLNAAVIGAREMSFSIVAMTLTLAAIFAPIAFASGITGRLFSEFAFSLAGSVVISGVVALTLSPMMCAYIIKPISNQHVIVVNIEKVFETIKIYYKELLCKSFKYKKAVCGFWLLSLLACFYFYQTTPKELAPAEDVGFLQVFANAPDSVSFDTLSKYSNALKKVYRKFPEILSYTYIDGIPTANQIISFVSLKPWGKRHLDSSQLLPKLQNELNKIAGLQAVAINPPALPGESGLPVQFVIKSIGDYKSLYNAAQTLELAARKSGLFLFVKDDLNYDQPTLQLEIDKDAAMAMNVTTAQIIQSLSSFLSGGRYQYFDLKGQTYEVIPQAMSQYQTNPELLNNIEVRSINGSLIPLSALVTMHITVMPAALNEFQKLNSVTISGVMAPGKSISDGLSFLLQTAKEKLAKNIMYDYAGNSRQFIQENNHMLMIFLASFLTIFIVLSMQFESFKDPLIILFGSVPLALMSALFPMKLGLSTINIYTQIGLLTLAGLISKHGILLVKFANVLRATGKSKLEAIIAVAEVRLRPILMTTLATIFGSLPLVFATGAGSISRFDIGIVIVIGMLLGTCFSLFIIPMLYLLLSNDTAFKSDII